jgi:hypothetical protein
MKCLDVEIFWYCYCIPRFSDFTLIKSTGFHRKIQNTSIVYWTPEARSARAKWLSFDLGEDFCYEVHVLFETLESFQYVVV